MGWASFAWFASFACHAWGGGVGGIPTGGWRCARAKQANIAREGRALEVADARPLLKPAEVAARLAVPIQTVYDWAAAGRLARVKLGRNVRFRPEDVEAFIAGNRQEALDKGGAV